MKKLFTLLLIITAFSAKADYWTQKANFPGTARELSFSFSIGNKGYVGCGYNSGSYLNDFWEYDPATNVWTQKADLTTSGRFGATGFSINNKGYAGLGASALGGYLGDFWEYDPALNSWTPIAGFAGAARYFSSAFSIGTKGYVGSGQNDFDFWEWDQTTNTWTQKDSLSARTRAVGFAINGKGYFSTGLVFLSGTYMNDLWEYDPVTNLWTQKADLPAGGRADAAAFTICDKGYVGTGGELNFYEDLWQYNPVLNQWIQKTNVPGGLRDDCAAFAIANKGYLGLGQSMGTTYLLDFWEYTPDSACATGIEEIANDNLEFTISPNPAHQYADISWFSAENKNAELLITTLEGKKVYETKLLTSDFRLTISDFPKGIYLVQIISNKKISATQKLVVE